jgi:hypothetical protein
MKISGHKIKPSKREGQQHKREFIGPKLPWHQPDWTPRKIPEGKFLWHNHIQHASGMPHGMNGFRYWWALKPINYRTFERCNCGVTDLPHYKRRGMGSGKCVSWQQIMRNSGIGEEEKRGGHNDK